jgi:hypothetical protein
VIVTRPVERKWLAAAAGIFALDIALHLPIEDFFDEIARRYGFFWYDALAQKIFIGLGLVLVGVLWWCPSHRRPIVRRALVGVVAAVILAKGFLLVAAIENIHYPQYALIVIVLVRAGLALEPAWLIAVGLGVVDEYYQFKMLPRGTPNYLDTDDIVLNAVGALLGVVIVLAWSDRDADRPLIPASTASRLVLLSLVVAAIFSPVARTPFWNTTPGGRQFHLLTWFETMIALGTLWAVVRRLASSLPQDSRSAP